MMLTTTSFHFYAFLASSYRVVDVEYPPLYPSPFFSLQILPLLAILDQVHFSNRFLEVYLRPAPRP